MTLVGDAVTVTGLSKRFGESEVLRHVDLRFEPARLRALLGPSGSGKSTILRILAGLESADSGRVWFDDEEATHVHARSRGIGFVFQHYALFRPPAPPPASRRSSPCSAPTPSR